MWEVIPFLLTFVYCNDDAIYDGLYFGVGLGVVIIAVSIVVGIIICFIRNCTALPE